MQTETLKTKTTLSASELRRKNWVNEEVLGNVIISDIERDGSIWVEAKGLNLQHEPTIEHYHLSKGNFEPIPLSPDILLSAGAKEVSLQGQSWVSYQIGDFVYDLNDFHLSKGVHWFQNYHYFRTGEELTITP